MSNISPPSQGKVCGVVITYFPPDGIEQRLSAIAALVDALVIVDNSGSGPVARALRVIADRLGADLISNPQNLGVAAALNQGVAFAREHHAARVLFFDHDSTPLEGFRHEMDAIWARCGADKQPGIVGCNYVLSGRSGAHFREDGDGFVPVDHVITSGSMYDTAMLTKLGPFRDEFFIDGIDVEYCWRALADGYCVCRTTRPLLKHALGNPVQYTLLSYRLGTSNHPAFRRYFMARNTVLILREYLFRLPRPALNLISTQLKGFILLAAFESHRSKKLGFAFLGLWHGLLGRVDMKPEHLAK